MMYSQNRKKRQRAEKTGQKIGKSLREENLKKTIGYLSMNNT